MTTPEPIEAALPPLPEPANGVQPSNHPAAKFTADQMHAYLAADRAARALTQGEAPRAVAAQGAMRPDTGAEDFGVPAEFAQRAENYAKFKVAEALAAQSSPSAESAAPSLPPYIYGHETSGMEKVFTLRAVEKFRDDLLAAAPRCPAVVASDDPKRIAELVVKAIEDAYIHTEKYVPRDFCAEATDAAYGAVMDALAGPAVAATDPVAWMAITGHGTHFRDSRPPDGSLLWAGRDVWTPLYVAPPPQPAAVQPPQVAREPAGWISVDERLPDVSGIEDGSDLLVANRGGVFVAVWEGTGATGFYAPNGDMFVQVAHWMPLPTAPKELP